MRAVYRRGGGDEHEVLVEARGPLLAFAQSGGVRGEFRLVPLGRGRFRMLQGGTSWRVCVDRDGPWRHVTIEGEGEARFECATPGRKLARDGAAGGLSSPMPGTVVKVLVAPGDRVEKGQDLLVVEAMKMEFKIAAPSAGVVAAIPVAAGDPCDAGQVLAEIVAAAEPG
jgi:acetyl/propionyl-CoA carboxylase alpha subunit